MKYLSLGKKLQNLTIVPCVSLCDSCGGYTAAVQAGSGRGYTKNYTQSWALCQGFRLPTTTTRQRYRAAVTRKIRKLLRSRSLNTVQSSHNECRHNVITNNFAARKHGHVDAAVLSLAQL